MEQLESFRRDFVSRIPTTLFSFEGEVAPEEEWWDLSLYDLMKGMRNVLDSMASKTSQTVKEVMEDLVTVEGRIQWILEMLVHKSVVYLSQLLKKARGKREIVATVLAGLELSKASQVRLKQDELFGEVEIVRVNQ